MTCCRKNAKGDDLTDDAPWQDVENPGSGNVAPMLSVHFHGGRFKGKFRRLSFSIDSDVF